jgi:hypothetical protein
MAVELVKCRVRRSGYLIERGDLSVHVDLEDGDTEQVMKSVLRKAAERDGRSLLSEYELDVFDRFGEITTTYVIPD